MQQQWQQKPVSSNRCSIIRTAIVGLMTTVLLVPNSHAQTKQEAPLVDLGAEMKAKTGGIPKVTYQDRETVTSKPPKPAETASEKRKSSTPSDGKVSASPKLVSKMPDKHVDWSYRGQTGPQYWGELSSKFSSCKDGKNQSPINLKEQTGVGTTNMPELSISYQDVPYRVVNNGHTLQVNYPLGSYIKIGDHRYELLQFHFHTPSEHQKEGFNYPMEAHLVHKDGEGNLAVMAIIFQEGEFNEQIQTVLDHLPKQIDKQQLFKNTVLNPVMFLPANTDYFKYSGSLTTPPCTEGVYWMVFKQTMQASVEQLQQMNEVMGENARPVQPIKARTLLKSWADQLEEPPMYEYY